MADFRYPMSHMNQPLIGIDKLLADSWNAMFKEWKSTLGWTLGLMFVPFLIQIAFALPQIAKPELAQSPLYQLVPVFLIWGATLYFMSGLIRYFLDMKKEVTVSFTDVVSLFWIGLLMTIILIPAFILFILPGIWLSVAFSMAMPVYLKEGKKGWQAIKTSYEIVKGRWWATFVRFLVPNLVYGIGVSFVFGILFVIMAIIASVPFSGLIHAVEQGAEWSDALAAAGPAPLIILGVCVLAFFVICLIAGLLLTLARTSIWTNIYKSLSETASK